MSDMNEIVRKFTENGWALGALLRNGEPWFVAKDVADILGYSETAAMTRYLEDDEKDRIVPAILAESENSGVQPYSITPRSIISESGLYEAIFRSTLPAAKDFKRWVKREVLPAIRMTGAYVPPETAESWLDDPDKVIEAMQAVKRLRAERDAAIQRQGQIRDRQLATSMATASAAVRKVKLLEDKYEVRADRKSVFSVSRDMGVPEKTFSGSRLGAIARRAGYHPTMVVYSYPADVWIEAYPEWSEDLDSLDWGM